MSREKPKMTFSVKIKNDTQKNVAYTIRQLLESKGFVCGSQNPNFVIEGNIHFSESENDVGVFVCPAISLNIFSADGIAILCACADPDIGFMAGAYIIGASIAYGFVRPFFYHKNSNVKISMNIGAVQTSHGFEPGISYKISW